MTITDLLRRAKHEIESGEASLHDAAEDIAAAAEQGATQRQIAEAVGKSPAWVNRLLRWRETGYQDTAFGPQAKASRQRAHVQASKQEKEIHSRPRNLLVKALGMLGSNHDGERANAAVVVENQRAKLGLTWDQLIIPANEAKARAA